MGPDNISELPRLLADLGQGAPPFARTVFDLDAPQFLTAQSVAEGAVTAFVTTMKGCDERCSFCIVPTTRGPERYRPSDEVVREVSDLVAGGVREVTLLGQTVNSYKDPLGRLANASDAGDDESEFAALLRLVAREVPGLVRLRYTSPHPRHLGPSLIEAHADPDAAGFYHFNYCLTGHDCGARIGVAPGDHAVHGRHQAQIGALTHQSVAVCLCADQLLA